MVDKQERLKEALGRLVGSAGIVSAALVRRDGIAVEVVGQKNANPETFGAMSAVAFGATETALLEVRDTRLIQILAEGEGQKMITLGASPELLLVAVIDAKVPWDQALPKAKEAAAAIGSIVA